MTDALSFFYAVLGAGLVTAVATKVINVFVDRYIAKPLDNRLERFEQAVLEYVKKIDEKQRDFAEIEKNLLILKKEENGGRPGKGV
jgi:hypothetical protein